MVICLLIIPLSSFTIIFTIYWTLQEYFSFMSASRYYEFVLCDVTPYSFLEIYRYIDILEQFAAAVEDGGSIILRPVYRNI
jgi:hypothetical protein